MRGGSRRRRRLEPEIRGDTDAVADVRDVRSTCGNSVLEYGEECDDGADNSDTRPDACRLSCIARACGDGVVDTGERCDDGNRVDGDGCPASCFPGDEYGMVPATTSPAIDSGLGVGGVVPDVDFLGNARPAGAGVDRGAYEVR